MSHVFGVNDRSGRQIRLTEERWTHISQSHPDVAIEQIEQTVTVSTAVRQRHGQVTILFKLFKHRTDPAKHLKVIVKYLNNHGFVVTAYFVRHTR